MADTSEGERGLRGWLDANFLAIYYEAIHDKCGFERVDDFKPCTEQDIRSIAEECGMKIGERSRLLEAIQNIPGSVLVPPKLVYIEREESEALNRLKKTQLQAEAVLTEFETRMSEVEKSSQNCKNQINAAFQNLERRVLDRKKHLLNNMESTFISKRKYIKTQQAVVEKTIKELKEIDDDCAMMLQSGDYGEVATRKRKILEKERLAGQKLEAISQLGFGSVLHFEQLHLSDLHRKIPSFGNLLDAAPSPEIISFEQKDNYVKVKWRAVRPEEYEISLYEGSEEKRGKHVSENSQRGHGDLSLSIPRGIPAQYCVKIRARMILPGSSPNQQNTGRWGLPTVKCFWNAKPPSFTTLLDVTMETKLYEYIDSHKKPALLYKASRDGFKASDFHRLCDKKGPTLTVLQRYGSHIIFGGYTPVSWNTRDIYMYDDTLKSFLYTTSDDKGCMAKYQIQSPIDAIRCDKSYGPTFGRDLGICDNSKSEKSSYVRAGHSYKLPSGTALCGQQDKLQIKEIEVFSIKL